MDAQTFARNVLEVLPTDLLARSGSVLYSSASTLRKGNYYLLGVNPGGENDGTNTIRQSLALLPSNATNAYLDEPWEPYEKGRHPLQRNVQALFRHLGQEPRDVCASNLIFNRSRREGRSGGFPAAEECWPVHEMILRVVQPLVVITFGRLPFEFLTSKWRLQKGDARPAGHANWSCQIGSSTNNPLVIGLPHLSIYAMRNHTEVLDWVKDHVQA